LTITGVSQDLTAAVTNVKDDGSKLTFDADFTIDMKTFGLKPKVLLGVFKVRNEVPVRASFTLTR
jgi:polyisoprenoid-binding protein YceI